MSLLSHLPNFKAVVLQFIIKKVYATFDCVVTIHKYLLTLVGGLGLGFDECWYF